MNSGMVLNILPPRQFTCAEGETTLQSQQPQQLYDLYDCLDMAEYIQPVVHVKVHGIPPFEEVAGVAGHSGLPDPVGLQTRPGPADL